MKQFFSIRWVFIEIFLLIGALFGAAAYLQLGLGLLPCPLCQLQRIMLGIVGLLTLFAIIHHPRQTGVKLYSLLIIFWCAVGGALSARQVFLQLQPTSEFAGNCGVSLEYILQSFPLIDAFKFILQGTGDCASVTWRFLSFSLAEWTLAAFALIALLGITQFLRAKNAR